MTPDVSAIVSSRGDSDAGEDAIPLATVLAAEEADRDFDGGDENNF